MTIKKLKELGWNSAGCWNNRDFYSFSEESKFSIFEHNGEYGIQDPYKNNLSLIYCNMTDDEIIKFTDLVKLCEDIWSKPKEYTFFQFLETEKSVRSFIKEMNEKE